MAYSPKHFSLKSDALASVLMPSSGLAIPFHFDALDVSFWVKIPMAVVDRAWVLLCHLASDSGSHVPLPIENKPPSGMVGAQAADSLASDWSQGSHGLGV